MYVESELTDGVVGLGIDIASIHRIAKFIDRYDRETLLMLFTPTEIERCQSNCDRDRSYAICFATKEAVGKALGTGLVGIDWNEIEANITHNKIAIALYGKARMQAIERGIQTWIAQWLCWDDHILVHVLAYSEVSSK
ncbi:ACP synthase [Cyanosarcina cf. burmensis CCALA 770]|jgi:holo-[acyl-carrier protein] synthase|nr:ACP synthase [Cyanosarcina cf. burmensis CCALA 770]